MHRLFFQLSFFLFFFLAFLLGCKGERMTEPNNSSNIEDHLTDEKFSNLDKIKVYFGHRSVGYNIIEGLNEILNHDKYDLDLSIVEYDAPSDTNFSSIQIKPGVFIHSKIGENSKPYSKIDDFADKIETLYGNVIDVALFKFCFVDINPKTDLKKVFEYYQFVMNRLKTNYPNTLFVHCTVPLTVLKKTFKTHIKTIIGRDNIWEYDNLIAINRYNQLLLDHYKGKEPVFDLAHIESTYADGERCGFERHGDTYFSLVPEYSHDGGHLNALGRRVVAEKLIVFLTNLKY
jgi:hypothetical protein